MANALRMQACLAAFLLGLWLAPGLPALAADPCPLLRAQQSAPDAATRIAAVACEEHQTWYRPFIGGDGGLAGSVVREAEAARLANGQPAWLRVTDYWRGSGLLWQVMQRSGATDCVHASEQSGAPACRSFVIDTPWSAAFVSWVMRRAALPGFRASASHVDYVRDAYRNPEGSAYRIADPRAARPSRGDLLCYVRVPGRSYGFGGLATLLSADGGGLGMHCDIVVSAGEGSERTARLVGGNVLDGVTMRMLPLTAGGHFEDLPLRQDAGPACSPDAPAACNANRQDWAALLQLRPQAELARLAPPPPMQGPSMTPVAPRCCVYCVVGGGIPRCPADAPQPPADGLQPVR
ncbi:DUF2272 domain-containing protein [Luteimonas terricola]|uniref:DUF2272 domain-containing protein n=1 Tax=Luteimonas terricola TaxID=645597 RepID=A0ABQ2EEX7_9GAMM|nr:DUF2272 domain-containing protein [Luteimonas terricola]GGK06477.1 hypothetical protein GCM10011394_14560 [Luteimonas terricola]